MGRREKILPYIDKNGCGIEIGPFFRPVAPKREGYNVTVIDVLSREQMVDICKKDPAKAGNIEEVDFIWRGESYAELTGKNKYYDWIIASHLVEHTPDLIGFFNDCDAVLKDDGVLCLVIPDKRFCFDYFRPLTGLSKVIDSHYHHNRVHTPGTVAEYTMNKVARAGRLGWDSCISGEYSFVYSLEDTARRMSSAREAAYADCHAWCFTPHSFRLMIQDLFSLGLLPFQEISFSPTEGYEFFITLGRRGRGIDKSRLEMLKIIESECRKRNYPVINDMIRRLTKPFRKIKRHMAKRRDSFSKPL